MQRTAVRVWICFVLKFHRSSCVELILQLYIIISALQQIAHFRGSQDKQEKNCVSTAGIWSALGTLGIAGNRITVQKLKELFCSENSVAVLHSPEGSKELPPGEGEGDAPKAASKLGCSRLV